MGSPWGDEFDSLFAEAMFNFTSEDQFEESPENATSAGSNNMTGGQLPHKWNPPYWVLLGIAIYLTIVGTIATVGNLLFIVTTMRWRLMRNNAHMILLLNMAICDFAISIVGYPYTTISGYLGYWPFGDMICMLYAFLCFLLSQVTMNTLVAVSIFRYISICKPHCQHLLNQRSSWIALFSCWIHALFWTVTPLIGWSSYTFEPTGVSCSLNWYDRSLNGITYTIGCTLCCYVLHVTTLVWCYRKIFTRTTTLATSKNWRQKQRENAEGDVVSPSPVARCESVVVFSFITENLSPLEVHVLRMNVIMVATFLMCWTPYAVVSCASLVVQDMNPFWYVFPTMFAKTSCMMNPIVYGLTNRFLRRELLRVVRQCCGLTTPMEEFQLMRQRQQEGLYNKEGVYTGGRNLCMCRCDRCVANRRAILSNSTSGQREMIELFIRQQREKDAEEQRKKNALQNRRPSSLHLDRASSQIFMVRSASLNIQISTEKANDQTPVEDAGSNPSPTRTETEDVQIPPELQTNECAHDHNHICHDSDETSFVDGPMGMVNSHSQTVTAV